MVLQVSLLAKSAMAYVALVGPGASVDIRVRFEITRGGKGLGTHGALMWFFLIFKNTF